MVTCGSETEKHKLRPRKWRRKLNVIRAIKCNGNVPLLIKKREITNLSRGKLLKRRHKLNPNEITKVLSDKSFTAM